MTNTETIWLTDVSQVSTVNDASLTRALISLDGCGQKIKTAAVEELLKRTKQECQKEISKLKDELQGIYDEQAGESL